MFRNDLESAIARADQLERDLQRELKKGKEAEARITELEQQLTGQREELRKLRKTAGIKGPKPPPQLKLAMAVGVAICLLIMALVGVVLMRQASPPVPAGQVKTASTPLGAEGMNFVQYVEHVASRCRVSTSGYLSRCNPPKLRKELKKAEERVGAQRALMGYCKLLGKGDRAASRVAASRIGYFYTSKLSAADGRVFTCLDNVLRHRSLDKRHKRVFDTWAQLGVMHGHKKAVLAKLATLPLERRTEGYRGLWKAGRLDIFPELEKLLQSDDPRIIEAVVRGFASLRDEPQRKAVCPLLAKVLKERREHKLTARAAYRLALSCKGRNNEEVLAAAGEQLGHQGPLDYWWVAAVSTLARSYARPTADQLRTAAKLLETIATEKRRSPYRRRQALDGLAKVDAERAKSVAEDLLKESPPRSLARAAERLLKSSK